MVLGACLIAPAAAKLAAADSLAATLPFLIPTGRILVLVMLKWRVAVLRAHRKPQLLVPRHRTHRLRTQLQVAADPAAVAVADMKAVVETVESTNLELLHRKAVSTTSGGAYRLRRFVFAEAFPNASALNRTMGAVSLCGMY